MLKEIKFIQSIGRFETAQPTANTSLNRCTLIFGENGWGKSTLADILRSLAANSPEIIAGRKTLNATAPSKAVLRFSTQNAVLENGAWSGYRPRVAVYDSAFINDNVYSGDIVSADHLKNQFGLVVGEEGVRLVKRLVELDGDNRENNTAIRSAETELSAVIRALGIPSMQIDAFLALAPRADIGAAIEDKQVQAGRARRAREIKAAAEPARLPVPTETERFREVLVASVEQVSAQALARVRAHIAAHEAKHDEGRVAHETWLEAGMALVHGDQCPFCGQALTDRSLLDAYGDFFSEEYKSLGASVRKLRETTARYTSGDFRRTIAQLADANAGHFHYWQEAAGLTSPDSVDTESLTARMERAAAGLDVLLAQKQAELTDPVDAAEAEVALIEWDQARNIAIAENTKVEAFLTEIRALKESLDHSDLPTVDAELKGLQAVKRRHEPDVVKRPPN